MWLGILTPGAHPSRPEPVAEATVFGWSARDRRRFDGPLDPVHGGVRVMRRQFHLTGVAPAPPRCFACRRPVPLPDLAAATAKRPVPALHGLDDAFPAAPGRATFALVHVGALRGREDPPLDEPAVLAAPGAPFALPLPLASLPHALRVLELALRDQPPPPCAGCGVELPGSAEQRDALPLTGARPGLNRRRRRSAGRRAA